MSVRFFFLIGLVWGGLCIPSTAMEDPADNPSEFEFRMVSWKPRGESLVELVVESPTKLAENTPLIGKLAPMPYRSRGGGLVLVRKVGYRGSDYARGVVGADGTVRFRFFIQSASRYQLFVIKKSESKGGDGPHSISLRLPSRAVADLGREIEIFARVEKAVRDFLDVVAAASPDLPEGREGKDAWLPFYRQGTQLLGRAHGWSDRTRLAAAGIALQGLLVGINNVVLIIKMGNDPSGGEDEEGIPESEVAGEGLNLIKPYEFNPESWRVQLGSVRLVAVRQLMLEVVQQVETLMAETEAAPRKAAELLEEVRGYRKVLSDFETGLLMEDFSEYPLTETCRKLLGGLETFLAALPPDGMPPLTEEDASAAENAAAAEEGGSDEETDMPRSVGGFRKALLDLIKRLETTSR